LSKGLIEWAVLTGQEQLGKGRMILIALGANLVSAVGHPEETLRAALASLGARGITVDRESGFYMSEAWPDPADPPYVNAVASVHTSLTPAELLHVLHEVEAEFGRKRGARNAPRTLDLDLIDYDHRIEHGDPELPHPRMETRAFVLVPLRDIAPDWRHPESGRTVDELIAALPKGGVTPLRGGAT
jgi:2-amino-4-hydroxy-6-hydroxymethyldihydropteridine diphosphokinase